MRSSCVCATNSLTGGRAVKVNEGGSFHLLVALRHQTWCRAVFIAGISGIGEYPRTYRQAAGNITVGKDRKSDMSGKSVSGRVDRGGRRIIEKKYRIYYTRQSRKQ